MPETPNVGPPRLSASCHLMGGMHLCRGLSTRGNGVPEMQNPVPRGLGNVLRSLPLKVNVSQRNPVKHYAFQFPML